MAKYVPQGLVRGAIERWEDALDRLGAQTCKGCGRIMSEREANEQGACNDCRPESA